MIGPEERAWADRKVPPVTALGMAAIGFVAGGVSYVAAYLPKHAPLGPPIACLVVAVVVLVTAVVLVAREPEFAWRRFFQVAGWGLLAYIVIAGMIEYAIIYDQTRGSVLVVMTLLLVTFTLAVPVLLGFTVARFQRASEARRPDPAA
jgi:drug/metabolite transporter (DMT)-like permease